MQVSLAKVSLITFHLAYAIVCWMLLRYVIYQQLGLIALIVFGIATSVVFSLGWYQLASQVTRRGSILWTKLRIIARFEVGIVMGCYLVIAFLMTVALRGSLQ